MSPNLTYLLTSFYVPWNDRVCAEVLLAGPGRGARARGVCGQHPPHARLSQSLRCGSVWSPRRTREVGATSARPPTDRVWGKRGEGE